MLIAMKAFPYLKYLVSLVFAVSIFSCVKTDDFDLPKAETNETPFEGKVTNISAVKSNFDNDSNEIYSFEGTETHMEGFVISNDEGGNFYKELILQDRASNPTAGIQILVDENTLYETYEFGSKLYVKLDGLSLWYNNGVLQLGKQNRGDVDAIPRSLIDDHLIRTTEVSEIIPLQLEIRDINKDHKNIYIGLENIQFNRNLIRTNRPFSFAAEATDEFDGLRQLESCTTGASITLSTSTFADFKSLLLPSQSGSIEGVLSRDFFDDFYVVQLNTPDDLDFIGERCDPSFLKCGENVIHGPEVLFEENFNAITDEEKLDELGWTNINVNGGDERFKDGTFSGDRYIRISAFNTEENPLEAWLVTPAINLDSSVGEVVSFEIMASYDNSTILTVYVTNNFTGNPLTTTWLPIDAKIPIGPSSQYGPNYTRSAIDISCLEGEIHLAFKYQGAAPDKTTTYDIDNIRVTGNK